jgi:hypothetical protein
LPRPFQFNALGGHAREWRVDESSFRLVISVARASALGYLVHVEILSAGFAQQRVPGFSFPGSRSIG